jgi:hypothetical protein
MSTLNSRDETELELLRAFLRAFVFQGTLPSIELIIKTGIDRELLVTCVDELRPLMDYLRGYKSLDSWFTQTSLVPYRTWLEEAGLADQYPHCISVLDAGMKSDFGENWLPLHPSEQGRYPGEEKRFARVKVWLTRKGEWIVWANHPTSDFRFVQSAEAALETIEALTPASISLCDLRGTLRSPALCMFADLRDLLRVSIEQKGQAVQRDKDALEVTDTLRNRFQ